MEKNKAISFFRSKTFGVILAVVCFFAVGFAMGRISQGVASPSFFSSSSERDFSQFWEVWNTIKNQYVDISKIDEEKMYYGAIKGMVDAIGDPATLFLDPKDTEGFNKSIEGKAFEGIGAELSFEDYQIVVVAPLSGSPAEKSGIRSGDIILKVDDREIVKSDTIFDVVSWIRGEAGTTVKLTVLHKGSVKPVEISIKRGEIDVPSMELSPSKYDKDYLVLRVSRFTDESVSAWNINWDKAVKEVVASKSRGLVLDLRGNPGGYFDSAIYSGNEFLAKGSILAKQQNKNGKEQVFRVTRDGKLIDIPLVVLVDEGSASASEILAGLLQQNNRAKIVGVNTYGKGTAQTIVNYNDGSTLHLTILKWLLPNGQWLNRENPIKPDIEVEYSEEDYQKGNDTQMIKALEIIKSR